MAQRQDSWECTRITLSFGSQCPALVVKNPPANAGDTRDADLIPGSRRSPGGGHSNPLQYSRLENPMDRGAWRAIVHGVIRLGHDLVTKPPPTAMRVPTNNPSLMPALGAHGVLIE